jgi:hypothetical protein
VATSKKAKAASPDFAINLLELPEAGFARGLDRARKSELEQLKRIEQESFSKRQRFWERTYLQAVYEVYWSWPSGLRQSFGRQAARLSGILPRPGSHTIRVLIDCTSPTTKEKMKSRWTLALRLAADLKTAPSQLENLGKKHGGVVGCARAYAARRKRLAAEKQEIPKKRPR